MPDKIFFTSDLHFGHQNILTTRPQFETLEEMEHTLIDNWNRTVPVDGLTYILGDFQMAGSPEEPNRLLPLLNGHKYLIRGNHDYFHRKRAFNTALLVAVDDYKEIKINKRKFVLCHYNIEFWKNREYGTIHLHGHMHHGPVYNIHNCLNKIFRYDVGVDANAFTPISARHILEVFPGDPKDVPRHPVRDTDAWDI